MCHQRAAAGADRFDRDHGLAHRPAGELGIGGDLRRAAGDQADIGRGAAHVEAQDLVEPERGRDMGGGGDAGRRARQRHGERSPCGGFGRGHAAGRMHDMQARALHLPLQPVEVAGGDRHDRGVEHGGRRALELAGLGIDLVRQRDERQRGRQRLTDGPLMGRIGIGMEERDGDAFHAARLHLGHGLGDRGGVGRQHGRPGVIDPLSQPEAAFRRNLRRTARRQVEAIEMLPAATADIEHVLEARGRHQGHRFDPVLDDGVGDQGRAVNEIVDFLGGEAGGGEGGQDTGDGIVALGRDLDRAHLAGRGQQGHQIGEGAADVDADLPAAFRHLAKPFCHPERSEGSHAVASGDEVLRCAQDDRSSAETPTCPTLPDRLRAPADGEPDRAPDRPARYDHSRSRRRAVPPPRRGPCSAPRAAPSRPWR